MSSTRRSPCAEILTATRPTIPSTSACPTVGPEAGELSLEAEANPQWLSDAVAESDYTDNIARARVTFRDTPAMHLRLVSVAYKVGSTVYEPNSSQMAELEDWLRRAYPISRLIVTRDRTDMTYLGRAPTCDEVNARLTLVRLFMQLGKADPPSTHYYGMYLDGVKAGVGFQRGCSPVPGFVASGPTGDPAKWIDFGWDMNNDGTSYGDWYGADELGHSYNQGHVLCNGKEDGGRTYPNYPFTGGTIGQVKTQNLYWGFDVFLRGPIVYPPTWTDVMSYCANEWISATTYIGVRDALVRDAALDGAQASAAGAPGDYLVIQGAIAPDGTSATLATAYRVTTDSLLKQRQPGAYTIRLRNASVRCWPTIPSRRSGTATTNRRRDRWRSSNRSPSQRERRRSRSLAETKCWPSAPSAAARRRWPSLRPPAESPSAPGACRLPGPPPMVTAIR